MTGESRSGICERARVWASLLPDGELSLFEQRLLDAHCLRCPDCRQLRDGIASVTAIVRETPLDDTARAVRIPSQRLRPWRPALGVFASGGVAALALVLALWIGPQTRAGHTTTRFVTEPAILFTPERSSAASQAIWTFKRQRGVAQEPGTVHRTGPILT